MKKVIKSVLILLILTLLTGCNKKEHYQVYAVKYLDGSTGSAADAAIGAEPTDSVRGCFMVWLLKSDKGRIILVDAGYIDTTGTNEKYVRPDIVLQRMNVKPDDITDLILTHPHWDHIGGINLFPKATVYMQKKDFEYYISEEWKTDGFSRGFTSENIPDILNVRSQGRLKFVEGDNVEILPGIRGFTGSRHSFENQYLLVNAGSKDDEVLLASDASWYYYNLNNLLSVPLVIEQEAYVKALKRMKTLVADTNMIIPGHDNIVFSKFPKVAEWIVKIK